MDASTSALPAPISQPPPQVTAATPAAAQSNGQPQGPAPTQPPQPPAQGLAMPPTAPDAGRALRKRAPTNATSASQRSVSPPEFSSKADRERERTTRSGTNFANRPKWMPKLKLKVSDSADGRRQSFLGPYDRDLDSEDEDLIFEEHFILRMPPGKDCDRVRELVNKRQNAPDVWFKFKDSRRAVFHVGDSIYPAKLVDLPCILESQKTLDNKHMFKVADIVQMLVVDENPAASEEAAFAGRRVTSTTDHLYPHGLTPPLRHVRKRRFRKRLNKQTIETVENEVDRLLADDRAANRVEEILFEDADPNLSDSEYIAKIMPPENPEDDGSDMEDVKKEDDDDAFAAAIEQALQENSDDDDSEDDDDSDDGSEGGEGDDDGRIGGPPGGEDGASMSGSESGSGSGSDDDEDDEEYSGAKKLVDDEIKQLQTAIAKKNADIAKVTNVALKNRFITAVAKMTADLETKMVHREQLLAEHRAQREKDNMDSGDDSGSEEEGAGGEDFFGDGIDMS